MASTSETTNPTPSKPELKSKYDVFLSFRGLDTRKKFTDHLYYALKREGIQTFRDDDEIERGEVIKSELQKSIRNSRMSVIVLSEKYAESTACLFELQLILEQYKKSDYFVLPVFYEVDPLEIKKQAKKLDFGEKKVTVEEVEGWSKALKEVARMAGMVFPHQTNGYEAKFIEEIVCVLKSKVVGNHLKVGDHLVGMDSRIERVDAWLKYSSTGFGVLLISGMGGIGKTTIAKVSYNSNHSRYDATCFLQNIREVAKRPNELFCLQRQLLSDILRKEERKVNDVDDGLRRMQYALTAKRVLLVLDDVDNMDQLTALVGKPEWFSPGSKIIITTRLESMMNGGEIYELYKPEKLCNCASLELFSWHAFGQKYPIESHIALSKRFVQHCNGLPLALEVLGSAVRGKNIDFWENKLQNLESTSDNKILQKLEISYNSIEDDRDKELFLDIACFFIGKKKGDTITILERWDYSALAGIHNLVDRNLLTIENEKLHMHPLLWDMGRQIVCRSKPPEDRSRIRHSKESFNILREKIGTNKIEGLILDVHKLTNPNMNVFETNTFEKMYNLRLLTLCGVQLTGSYKAFPKRLVWLHWRHFPSESFPNDFPLENLVALDLRYSNLKQFWTGSKVLGSLKILNLSHSPKLTKTPNFSRIPNLEKLILKACPRLLEVDESIVKLQKIQSLNLRDCKKLRKLPRNISTVESLVKMDISGCSNLMGAIEELEKMKSLQVLNASRVDIDDFLTKEVLSQGFIWPWVLKKRVTTSLASLASSLVDLNLSHCKLTEDAFPRDLSNNLSQLQRLSLAGNPISSQPNFIKDLTGLLRLDLSACSKLRQIMWISIRLEMLDVEKCQALETITYEDSRCLEEIVTKDCVNLSYVQKFFKIFPVRDMDVELLNRIGFFNLDSIADVEVFFLNHYLMSRKKRPIQIMCEGIMYTTFFPGGEVPHWFSNKNCGSTISFTATLSPHFCFSGLTLCSVYTFPDKRQWFRSPLHLLITNKSSGKKDVYSPGCFGVQEEGGDMVWLCHFLPAWLYAVGDEVEVSFWIDGDGKIKECGVHLMYFKDEGERSQYCRTVHSWDKVCSHTSLTQDKEEDEYEMDEDDDEDEERALIKARCDRRKEEDGGADEQVNITETGEVMVLMAEVIMAKEDE